jgi:hypothetical protein
VSRLPKNGDIVYFCQSNRILAQGTVRKGRMDGNDIGKALVETDFIHLESDVWKEDSIVFVLYLDDFYPSSKDSFKVFLKNKVKLSGLK